MRCLPNRVPGFSAPRQESDTHGPERIKRPLRQAQADTGYRWSETENQNHSIQPQPGLERNPNIVSNTYMDTQKRLH